MNKISGYLIALILVSTGVILFWIGIKHPLRIISPNGVQIHETRSISIEQILAEAGVSIGSYDRVTPMRGSRIGWEANIVIERASQFRIIDLVRGLDISIPSRQRLPANLLLEAGILLYPGDILLQNGKPIDHGEPLPYQPAAVLQILPAQQVQIRSGQSFQTIRSARPTLGQALWDTGITLATADQLSEDLRSPLRFLETVDLLRARPLFIRLEDVVFEGLSTSRTTGSALSQVGISLQGLDYSIPAEKQPLPPNGNVDLIRVFEDVVLEQTVIPYDRETVLDPETPLDQIRIIESGQYGLKISRERIRYENDVEINRMIETEWIAAQPKTERVGIGTQIVLGSINTPQGTLEYWRSLNAYATSYSPCRLGIDGCSYTTASGMALEKGVVAVKCSLFPSLRGLQVYVPGYGVGVIGDCGGGVAGTFWIDLGFSDEDYESWHNTVSIYFLTPVPATIPYELQ